MREEGRPAGVPQALARDDVREDVLHALSLAHSPAYAEAARPSGGTPAARPVRPPEQRSSRRPVRMRNRKPGLAAFAGGELSGPRISA